jgi:hypothetical protein
MTSILADAPISSEPAAIRAWTEGRTIYIELHDGRFVGFPADRFSRLAAATDEQLKQVAVAQNISMKEIVEAAIAQYLKP